MQPGDLVAVGRTSDVYEFGPSDVIKVSRPHVPDEWARLEADFTVAIGALDIPAPRVVDVIELDGRAAIVSRRVHGQTMWQRMLDEPSRIGDLVALLAEMHRRMPSRFVAGFIGSPAMNLVDVASDGSSLSMAGAEVPLTDDVRRDLAAAEAGLYAVGVRPEHFQLVAPGSGVIDGTVSVVEELGSEAFLHIRTGEGEDDPLLVVRAPGETSIRRNDAISITFNGPIHVFDAEGNRLGD